MACENQTLKSGGVILGDVHDMLKNMWIKAERRCYVRKSVKFKCLMISNFKQHLFQLFFPFRLLVSTLQILRHIQMNTKMIC